MRCSIIIIFFCTTKSLGEESSLWMLEQYTQATPLDYFQCYYMQWPLLRLIDAQDQSRKEEKERFCPVHTIHPQFKLV